MSYDREVRSNESPNEKIPKLEAELDALDYTLGQLEKIKQYKVRSIGFTLFLNLVSREIKSISDSLNNCLFDTINYNDAIFTKKELTEIRDKMISSLGILYGVINKGPNIFDAASTPMPVSDVRESLIERIDLLKKRNGSN